jgi:hypothetical protein
MTAAVLVLSTPECGHERTFAATDLPDLVARPNEAPPGLVYAPRLSGGTTAQDLLDDPARQAALEKAGLRAAYVGLMGSPDLLDYLVLAKPGQQPPKHAALIRASDALFGSSTGADDGLELFRDDAVNRIAGERALPSDEFGDDAFAFQGTDAKGRQSIFYGWRVGDLIQTVESRGPVDPADVLFMARNMRRRAIDAS